MSEPNATHRDQSLRINAALDGELDAANALSFEREREGDPSLQASFAQLRSARDALRALGPEERASDALRARVLALAEDNVTALPSRGRSSSRWLALAASVAILAFIGGYGAALQFRFHNGDPELQALVAGYARGQVSGQPFDVASSDRHTVKPWLAARVTLGAAVVDLADQGFPLAGGRIDIVDGAPVPTMVYRRREHFISVSELPLRGGAGESASEAATLEGFHIERWADSERAYVAISDLDAGDLEAFTQIFRRAQSAAAGPVTPSKP